MVNLAFFYSHAGANRCIVLQETLLKKQVVGMLRVVTPEEMRKIENIAVAAGTTAETLMEQAGKETASVISDFVKMRALSLKAFIIAGTGNNGGDGYVVARYLLQQGISVQVAQVGTLDPQSLVKKQRRRYEARGGKVIDLDHAKLTLPQEGVLVDALFGTGFRGRQQENTIALIEAINSSKLPIIAVDVPSGLDAESGTVEQVAVKALITCTMEYPKLGFFIVDGWNHVGEVMSLPIGLRNAAESVPCMLYALEEKDVRPLLPSIVRTRNKYDAGHVAGLAGSHGMAGAALMTSLSAMRSGAGIVHLLYPEEYSAEFTGQPLEIVRVPYQKDDLGILRYWIDRASSAFVGPGLGTSTKLEATLESLWPNLKGKVVLDADALNWLARSHGTKFGPLPNSILTPHLGELHRFLPDKEPVSAKLLQSCQQLVDTNQTNLILKGGPSFLFSHGMPPTVMMRGDPGMATAGSGDVLTGILAALMAQGLTARDAMLVGSFLHGKAGELAARDETSYCMIASSIIAKLPQAFQSLIALQN